MSRAAFPVNDLLRRKVQTSLTVATLTLSVGATLFLLLFGDRIGLGMTSAANSLTQGLSAVLSQFILFVGVLIFVVGAVLTSYLVFLMMTQRTRDFGLIKAAGCPNSLVAGYFMTELLATTAVSCTLGIGLGFLLDFAAVNLGSFQAFRTPPNFWFAPLVFVAFFVLALVFGTKPILNASRMSPIQALSPVSYFGLSAEKSHKPLSRTGVTWNIAARSLIRRSSVTLRIVILLSAVFVLLTVSIAGGVIARETTESWLQKSADTDAILIAHSRMTNQYNMLLSTFTGTSVNKGDFNYSDPNLAISDQTIQQLAEIAGAAVDARLVLQEHIREISNFTIDPETAVTYSVGDNREGDALVVGVNPQTFTSPWALEGRFLTANDSFVAVIGDSIAREMYSPDPPKKIHLSDPLVQSVQFQENIFGIVGVRIDSVNNGKVIYVPMGSLQNVSEVSSSNVVFVRPAPSSSRNEVIAQVEGIIKASNPNLTLVDLRQIEVANFSFLNSTWSTIMLLPFFTLLSAALCLVGYIMLSIEEQRQEFAILRAIGAKPRITMTVVGFQSMVVLLSGFGFGISFGVVITLLILIKNPIVTSFTIVEIAAYLLAALVGMFLLSLYPARRLAKASILKIMS